MNRKPTRHPKHAHVEMVEAYPYRVNSRVTTHQDGFAEHVAALIRWLNRNCRSDNTAAWYHCGEGVYQVTVGFQDGREAMMFKLAWGGQ